MPLSASELQAQFAQSELLLAFLADEKGRILWVNALGQSLLALAEEQTIAHLDSSQETHHEIGELFLEEEILSKSEKLSFLLGRKISSPLETILQGLQLRNNKLSAKKVWTMVGSTRELIPVHLECLSCGDEGGQQQARYFFLALPLPHSHSTVATTYSTDMAEIVHDLRTPISSFMGMGEALLSTTLTEEQKNYVQIMQRCAHYLLQLSNDLLDLSKPEAQKWSLHPAPLHLPQLLQEVSELFSQNSVQKNQQQNISFHLQIDPSLPYFFIGDPIRLKQILFNLLHNAYKFTSQGHITLRLQRQNSPLLPGNLLLQVQDSGIGIADDKVKEIFRQYAQGSDDHALRYGGSGLGLYISRQWVEAMGGTMWVERGQGKGQGNGNVHGHGHGQVQGQRQRQELNSSGSTFSFTLQLPLTDEASWRQQQLPESAHPHSKNFGQKKWNIFLCDDCQDHRLLMDFYLKDIPHTLTSVEDGTRAKQILQNKTADFDLAIIDMQIPGISGAQLMKDHRQWEKQLGRNNRPLPIIALSSNNELFPEEMEAPEFNYYMCKPLNKQSFLELLHNVLLEELPEAHLKKRSTPSSESNADSLEADLDIT